ncbi:RDD family protein [Propionivibrio limicola]|uniref:RDD family protein n=1 Tax=Propionivibrio limicola TaxID=167645 RepID=UPI001291F289|nr:RDD family protein [Propionivibrio limicola]
MATPEGCELSLRLAGPAVRVRAWLFDFVIRLMIFAGAMIVAGYLGRLGAGVAALLAFVLEWLYPTLFEVLWHGQTPGKKFSNLVVLNDDGTPVGWGASFARNTLRFVDFLPFAYACGLFSLWLTPDAKRLGDLLAGTVVVYRDETRFPKLADDHFQSEPPPFPLTLAEQRALIEYRLRATNLTTARAEELAELALPLTEGMHPEAAQARLFRIANGLLGRHKQG